MSYNDNNGSCCGGWGGPFGGLMGGFGFDALILLLFFGLMGGGMWGGFGGFGGGFGGYGGFQQATTTAAETAALVGQQQVADRVAGIATGVDAVAGLVTAQGTKLETVKDAVVNGFYANQTNLCELGNNIAMQAVNNQNATTALLNDMRFANSQCCCETKQLIQSSFCDLRHQMQSDKCDTMQAIANSQAAILAQLNADKFDRMQDKLAAANERNSQLKSQLDRQEDTSRILAAIQANGCKPACAPAPCGTAYAYTPCNPCNPCYDGVQRAVNNALGERIGELLFPTTAPAATA
ncbi:hypothetical protein [Fibrobacter sp.]|uniref:hypothetical protein n=1 Tax=Fibrobacter sp. TaxID=35828 RepID=UPI0025B85E43|nr:hypothetical protein [Fibrobacter sp.]MBR4007842.1 hypothetical protein [Fibrobacter sp.]